jgi:hypothetical protein
MDTMFNYLALTAERMKRPALRKPAVRNLAVLGMEHPIICVMETFAKSSVILQKLST